MIPVYQTKFLSEGNRGNCFSAAVASILEIPLEDVPPFEEQKGDWTEDFFNFSLRHNLKFVIVYEEEDIAEYVDEKDLPNFYYIAVGASPRNISTQHAVVYKQGKLVHDPHFSGDGILTDDRYYLIIRN